MAEAVKQRLDHDQDEEEEEEEEEEEFLESDSFSSDSDDGELRSKVSSSGPLYQLTSLKEQLPIKRSGLSKYYQGKSQSYTSLTAVRSVEDLRKKENPFNEMRKMNTCKSYAGLAPSLASCASSLMSGSGRHLCKN